MRKRTADRLDAALGGALTATGVAADPDVAALAGVATAIQRLADRPAPSEEARRRALAGLRRAVVDAKRARAESETAQPLGAWWRGWIPARGLQAAVVLGVLALIVTVAISASLARSDVSQAVRGLFDGDTDTKVAGAVTDVRGDQLLLDTSDGPVVVTVDDATLITDEDKTSVELDDIAPGQSVDVKGERQDDGTVLAARIKLLGAALPATDAP